MTPTSSMDASGENTSAPAAAAPAVMPTTAGANAPGASHPATAPTCPRSSTTLPTTSGNTPEMLPGEYNVSADVKRLARLLFEQGAVEALALPNGAAVILTATSEIDLDNGCWLFVRLPQRDEGFTAGDLLTLRLGGSAAQGNHSSAP